MSATARPRRGRGRFNWARTLASLRKEASGRATTFIDATKLTLKEWLIHVEEEEPTVLVIRNRFPTNSHTSEFLQTVGLREEGQIQRVLRHFLPRTGTSFEDLMNAEQVIHPRPRPSVQAAYGPFQTYRRRLLFHVASSGDLPVWEGLDWVVGLLPQHPNEALQVASAFAMAYNQVLSDGYLAGVYDAMAIIRGRYLISDHTADKCISALATLTPRQFEFLGSALYRARGYKAVATRYRNDGGIDIIAKRSRSDGKEVLFVQCKHQMKVPVGVKPVRELIGILEMERATRAVLITSGRYTSGAHAIESSQTRLGLIDRPNLIRLLNKHLGATWYDRLDRILTIEQAICSSLARDSEKDESS
jgi:restriction system protein